MGSGGTPPLVGGWGEPWSLGVPLREEGREEGFRGEDDAWRMAIVCDRVRPIIMSLGSEILKKKR